MDGIAFVPQGNRVFDEMTVLENMEIGGFHLPKKNFQTGIVTAVSKLEL